MSFKRTTPGKPRLRRRRTALPLAALALAAIGLLAAASGASASQEGYELFPPNGSFPTEFNFSNSLTKVTMNLNGAQVKCSAKTGKEPIPSLSGSGEMSGATSGNMTLTFHNCTAEGTFCKSPGQENGTIVSEELPVELTELSGGEAGISFGANEATGRLMTFSCFWGLVEFEVSGGSESSPIVFPEDPEELTTQFIVALGAGESSLESSIQGGKMEAGADISASYAVWAFPEGEAEIVGPPTGPIWNYPGEGKFSVSATSPVLKISGNEFVCKGGTATDSGSFVSESRAVLRMRFEGCGEFRSPGQPKGTIVTSLLQAKLVQSTGGYIDLLLTPLSDSDVFMEFSPWPNGGVPNYEFTGSLVVAVEEPGFNESSSTLRFRASEDVNQQIEEGGPTYGLSGSISGGSSSDAQLITEATITAEEGELMLQQSE